MYYSKEVRVSRNAGIAGEGDCGQLWLGSRAWLVGAAACFLVHWRAAREITAQHANPTKNRETGLGQQAPWALPAKQHATCQSTQLLPPHALHTP